MFKLYLLAMLVIGYGLGVWSSAFLYKNCYKKYADEICAQYKKLLEEKEINKPYKPSFLEEEFDGRGVA